MKRFLLVFCLFILTFSGFATEERKSKKDEAPQGDSYYRNFDEMDDHLDQSLEEGIPKDQEEFQRRAKKSNS